MLYGEFDVEFYEWFFETYALPRMKEENLDSVYHDEKEHWMKVAETLPQKIQMSAEDMLGAAKHSWGQYAFTLGVQAGILLIAELPEGPTL